MSGVAHEEVVLHVVPKHPLVVFAQPFRKTGVVQSAEQFDVVVVEADGRSCHKSVRPVAISILGLKIRSRGIAAVPIFMLLDCFVKVGLLVSLNEQVIVSEHAKHDHGLNVNVV